MWLYANKILRAQQIAEAAAHNRPRGNLSDLYPRWLGARELLLRGRDPYNAQITREIQQGYYGRVLDPNQPNDPKDQQAFAYPLYVVFILAPTVKLSFALVQSIFFWLLVALTAASVPLWMRVIGWRVTMVDQVLWCVLALGCFPAVQGLKLQQLTLLVAPLIALSLAAVVRGRLVWGGMLLAVATIKPQLVLPLAAWLFLWMLGDWRRRQRLLWSFLGSLVVLMLGAGLLLPGWVGEFRAASTAYFQYTGGGRSVLDVLLTPVWGRVASAILVVVAFVLFWRVRAAQDQADFHWSISMVMATTLMVIPMFSPYNQLLLLPAIMMIVRFRRRLWRKNAALRFLTLLAGISILWPWFAAAALALALLFIPGATVQRAWAAPLYTSNVIPVAITALLLAGGSVLRDGAGTGMQKSEVRMQK